MRAISRVQASCTRQSYSFSWRRHQNDCVWLKSWIKQIAIKRRTFFPRVFSFLENLLVNSVQESVFISVTTQLHANAFKRGQILLTQLFQSGLDIETPFVVLSFKQFFKSV